MVWDFREQVYGNVVEDPGDVSAVNDNVDVDVISQALNTPRLQLKIKSQTKKLHWYFQRDSKRCLLINDRCINTKYPALSKSLSTVLRLSAALTLENI